MNIHSLSLCTMPETSLKHHCGHCLRVQRFRTGKPWEKHWPFLNPYFLIYDVEMRPAPLTTYSLYFKGDKRHEITFMYVFVIEMN